LSKSSHHRHLNHDALSTVIQDFGKSQHLNNELNFLIYQIDENEQSKSILQQEEYESQLVHNIILNLLKRRYELHTVHEKKDKVCLIFLISILIFFSHLELERNFN